MKNIQTNRGVIPFLILTIIGIFIALFAMGFFTTEHPFGIKKFNFKYSLHLKCGLTVYAPKTEAKLDFPYRVYGYANGCDWEPNDTVLGTVTLLGSNGVILSQNDLLVTDPADGQPYYFDATIDIPKNYYDETGTVVLENLLPGLQHQQITIPVRFNSHL